MKKMWPRLLLCAAISVSGVTPTAYGQGTAGTTNADIMKMIQAGLPESIVIDKINEGTGRWDTSVDALIALKQIGATEAELQAFSSKAISQPKVEVKPVDAGQQVLGGILKNSHGNITLAVRGDSSGFASLRFRVVLFEGHPALVTLIACAKETPMKKGPNIEGDLLITQDRTIFFPYGVGFQRWSLPKDLTPISNPIKDVHYPKMGKNGTNFELGYEFGHKDRPTPTRAFLDLLFSDFTGTVATILQAAGISDPATQLDSASDFHPPSKDEVLAIIEQHNQAVDAEQKYAGINAAQRIVQEQEEAKLHPKPAADSGAGMLSVLNVVQGVSNLHQAYQDAKVADLSHDLGGQLRAATNATTAEMQTIGAASGNATTIQPLAPTQPVAAQQTPKAAATTPKATGFTYNVSHGQTPAATPATKTVASNTQPKSIPNPGGVPSGVSTGTVAPANCVAVNVEGPCIPLSQYHPTPQPATGQGICPPSGFVPGVMFRQSSDVSVGVPCKPGTPYGPLIATTSSGGYTGVTPPDAASGGTSGSGSSGTSGTAGGPGSSASQTTSGLNYCVTTRSSSGGSLEFVSSCPVPVTIGFFINNGGKLLTEFDDPGKVDDSLLSGVKQVIFYACPSPYYPVNLDGSSITQPILQNSYICKGGLK